jgi:hypothetical protein
MFWLTDISFPIDCRIFGAFALSELNLILPLFAATAKFGRLASLTQHHGPGQPHYLQPLLVRRRV